MNEACPDLSRDACSRQNVLHPDLLAQHLANNKQLICAMPWASAKWTIWPSPIRLQQLPR